LFFFFFFQAEDGIRDRNVTGVQTCALPISDNLMPLFLAFNARLDNLCCSRFNFCSILAVNWLLSNFPPVDRMAKSVMPRSIPTALLVLSKKDTSVSTKMEMKYFPLGFRLMVALIMRPSTSRLLAKRTNPSLGNLILLPRMAMFPFVYFVV